MFFKVSNKKHLKSTKKIWEKVSNLTGKEFYREPFYGEYIKTYGDKINTNFQGKKVSKQNAPCKFLSLIIPDSVIGVNKKYYPQTLLESVNMKQKKD